MYYQLLFILLQLAGVLSKPDGAPLAACADMTPQHSAAAQVNTNSPYSISADKAAVVSGKAVMVTVQSTSSSATFKGIFLQTRKAGDTTPYGTWMPPTSDYKNILCSNNQALTHTNRNDKTLPATFQWTAPTVTTDTTFNVYMTIVIQKVTFYVMLSTGNIVVSPAIAAPATTTPNLTPTTPTPMAPMTTGNATMATGNATMATAMMGMTTAKNAMATAMTGMSTTKPSMTTAKTTMSTTKGSMATTTQKMQTTSAAPSVGMSATFCLISIMLGVLFVLRGGRLGY